MKKLQPVQVIVIKSNGCENSTYDSDDDSGWELSNNNHEMQQDAISSREY